MSNAYVDFSGSKKKFLIPLLVLMLCTVSLTGAAYAYNTKVTSDNAGLDSNYVSIDLYNEEGTSLQYSPVESEKAVVLFTTVTDHVKNKVQVFANTNGSVKVGETFIKVLYGKDIEDGNDTGEGKTDTYDSDSVPTVKVSLDGAVSMKTKGADSVMKADLSTTDFDFTFELYSKEQGATSYSPVNAGDDGKYTIEVNKLYKVVVNAEYANDSALEVSTPVVGDTPAGNDIATDKDSQGMPGALTDSSNTAEKEVKKFQAEFNNLYQFNVTIEAESVESI